MNMISPGTCRQTARSMLRICREITTKHQACRWGLRRPAILQAGHEKKWGAKEWGQAHGREHSTISDRRAVAGAITAVDGVRLGHEKEPTSARSGHALSSSPAPVHGPVLPFFCLSSVHQSQHNNSKWGKKKILPENWRKTQSMREDKDQKIQSCDLGFSLHWILPYGRKWRLVCTVGD